MAGAARLTGTMAQMSAKRTGVDRHLTAVPDTPANTPAGTTGGAAVGEPAAGHVTPAPPPRPVRDRHQPDPTEHALFGIDPDVTLPGPGEVPTSATTPAQSADLPAGVSPLFQPDLSPAEIYRMLSEAGAPRELLDLIEGFGEDVEALRSWLREIGLAASPQESLDMILAGWRPLLKRSASALDAELSGAEFLWMFEFTADGVDPFQALSRLITNAASTGTPEALAIARVLAQVGPAPIRPTAVAAAHRLAASGVKDMPWVRTLGKPEWVSAFSYVDSFGSQQSLAIEFRYGKRSHACVALIDHGSGGGIKDCWFTHDVGQIRAELGLASMGHAGKFREYTAEQAATTLSAALAAPPCPEDPEQVEDVGTYLRLLRDRLRVLPEPGAATSILPDARPSGKTRRARHPDSGTASARSAPPPERRGAAKIHRVKVTLAGAKPPIWRRLEVPSTTTLADLHEILQAAFEWYGGHLWVFDTPKGEFGIPDAQLDHGDAARLTLARAAPKSGSRITYTYDFGDDWEHVIDVEAIIPAGRDLAYPRCTGGRRAAPPEDCGGAWGYADLIETVGDPDHPEHAAMLDWLGVDSPEDFDPRHFDVAEVNVALAALTGPRPR